MLACGVFGNITDEDVARTIRCCAGLCATGGTVVWDSAGAREPDLVPQICEWFAAEDFELLGVSGAGDQGGVGAHRFAGTPCPVASPGSGCSPSSGPTCCGGNAATLSAKTGALETWVRGD